MELLLPTIILIGLTLLPALELRFSIPVGILATSVHLPFLGAFQGFNLPWWYVAGVCIIANILLGLLLHFIIKYFVERMLLPYWPWFAKFYKRRLVKAQQKIHPHVERWGWLGLAAFIAIPLPGSGVYTGTLAAYALGFEFKHFALATILGVVAAGSVVTALTLSALSLA